jgi:hypothetical protein
MTSVISCLRGEADPGKETKKKKMTGDDTAQSEGRGRCEVRESTKPRHDFRK